MKWPSHRYFVQQIERPLIGFITRHATEDERDEILFQVQMSWPKPRSENHVDYTFARQDALRLQGMERSLKLAERATINRVKEIVRSHCEYESHRLDEEGKASRRGWNSPDTEPYDPDNHHSYWHSHNGTVIEPLDSSSSTCWELFSNYLTWLQNNLG